jgi:parallel beta-helix repeat protein
MINNKRSKRGEMYHQKRGAIALVGLVAMLVVVVAGSLFLASQDENAITGASIGIQEMEGECNITITETVNNIGHDFLCQNTDGFIIDADNIVFDCQDHFIKCVGGCTGRAGIRIDNQDNVTIKNCYVYNFTDGVSIENSAERNRVEDSFFYNNSNGININFASQNNITGNVMDENTVCGINVTTDHPSSDDYNRIYNNIIMNSTTGSLEACSNASSLNYWYSEKNCASYPVNIMGGYCMGGNYWSSYDGKDLTGDGLGNNGEYPYGAGGGIEWITAINSSGDYNPLVESCLEIPAIYSENSYCGNKTLNSSSGEGNALVKSNKIFLCNGTKFNGNVSGEYKDDMRGFEIKNVHNYTIIGCEVYNFTYGIYIQNAHNITLINMTVRDNNHTGIYIGPLTSNINITGSTIGDFGSGMQKYGIKFEASRSGGGNSLVENNVFVNNTEYGILLEESSDGNTFLDNNISGSVDGFLINSSDGQRIDGNIIFNNSDAGIKVLDSTLFATENPFADISNINTFYNNTHGYYLEDSSSGNEVGGIFYNNTNGIYLENSDPNIEFATLYNNSNAGILINNTLTTEMRISNVSINGSAYGVYVEDSSNIIFGREDNEIPGSVNIYRNTEGVRLINTNNSEFSSGPINIHDNVNGTILQNSYYNKFDSVDIFDGGSGLILINSDWNNFTNGNISNHTTIGLSLNSSNNNTFYNNFFDNSTGGGTLVEDDSSNIWNTTRSCISQNIIGGSCIGGNYWPNYFGADTNGDRIGDTETPYNITDGVTVTGRDYLPLTYNLAGCGNISSDVLFVQSVPSNGTCFNVVAHGITLDFAGLNLTGNGSGCGINIANFSNITVKNANIQNFATAICVDPAVNINISNNNITNNINGITFDQINDSYISNNKFSNNSGVAINFSSSYNNTVQYNLLNYSGTAIKLSVSSNNTFNWNNITYGGAGIISTQSSNLNISNSFVINNTGTAISLSNSGSNTIDNNNIGYNGGGIVLSQGNSNTITNNNIYENNVTVISLSNSGSNTISNNSILQNKEGLTLTQGNNNTIQENTFINNNGTAISLSASGNNNVDNNEITYNLGGLSLNQGDGNNITNSVFSNNNGTAINISGSDNNAILLNNITQNINGFVLNQVDSSNLSGNKFYNNSGIAVGLNGSENNTIQTNNLTLNYEGIKLSISNLNTIYNNTIINQTIIGLDITGSYNNTIYNNYFNNTNDAIDFNGSNYYNSTYDCNITNIIDLNCSGGNYWPNYEGKDSGSSSYPYNWSGDGVGDTNIPFVNGTIIDYLPLTYDNGTASGSCLTISSSTKLGGSVSCTTGDGITIAASGITLDCDNKSITGSGLGSGILVDGYNNVVIKNCNIQNFYYGMNIVNAKGTQIIGGNNLQLNDFYGIYLYNTNRTLIEDNILINDNNGVYMIDTIYTNITNNTINLQKKFYGIYGFKSTYNLIENNTLYDNYHGIYLLNSSYTNATANNISSSDKNSVFLHKGTSYSSFVNNNLTTALEGIRTRENSIGNKFIGNQIEDHEDYGVRVTNIKINNVSDRNEFINNTIRNNTLNVYLYNATNHYFDNNTISLGTSGIQALTGSNDLVLVNNTINSTLNTTACLEINDSSSATISDNRFYNHVHLNNADHTIIQANNTVNTYLLINLSDNITVRDNNLQYVDIEPTTGTDILSNTMTQLVVLQFANGHISSNTIANNNLTAFDLQTVSGSYINDNDIQNTTLAMYLHGESTNNRVYDNWLKDNAFGLNVSDSSSTTIYNNYFKNGASNNVYDGNDNTWQTDYSCAYPNIVGGPCQGGNFYSDYYGLDNGANGREEGDGVGDQPAYYTIATGNTDPYPLVLYVARQYFDQNNPYTETYNAYGNVSGLLEDEQTVPNEVQVINYTSVNDSVVRVELIGLFNQTDVHAETLKINYTENKTAVNRTGVTGEASTFAIYLYHNNTFDAGVYVCPGSYNLSLNETCSSVVNLDIIGYSGGYILSQNEDHYKVRSISNDVLTVGINKDTYCGASILHDVTLTEDINCTGSAFYVSANDVTIDFAGYTLTGDGSGIGVNISDHSNVVVKNANIVNFNTGIYVDPATGIVINSTNVSNSGTGIYFSEINRSSILNSYFLSNTVGINFSNSHNNNLTEIQVNNSSNTGLYFSDSDDNNVVTSFIGDNTVGFNLTSSSNNSIVNNYFDNTLDADETSSENMWNTTYNCTTGPNIFGGDCIGGNYWASYIGWDIDSDGVGNTLTPYNISNGLNRGDSYPLTPVGYIACGGTTQEVTTNITLVSDLTTTGTCFTVTADNVTLDCDGHSIVGDKTGLDNGVKADSVQNITIKNCDITNFYRAILIDSSDECLVINNNLSNSTYYGVRVSNGDRNNINNNSINNCSNSGFSIFSAEGNIVSGNTISDNDLGLEVGGSASNNSIYNNNFNNTINVQDTSGETNYWNTTYDCSVSGQNILREDCLGGNFWGDYNGTDDGNGSYPHNESNDGIGDVPSTYNITNSSDIVDYDYLPLVITAVCNDSVKAGGEACDGSDFGSTNTSCTSLGYLYGSITCSSCVLDTSACTNTTPIVNNNNPGGGGGGGGGGAIVVKEDCTESWECGDWSECIGGTQTRNCNDVNLCESLKKSGTVGDITNTAKPKESRTCTLDLVPEEPLPYVPEEEPSLMDQVLPENPLARNATLASIAALLVFGGVYASWYLASPRNRIKRKLRKIHPMLGQESHDILKTGYLEIYHLYLKLSEGHKQNYYSKVTKLREKLEDQLKAEKQIQELLENRKGDIKEQKEQYLEAYKEYQKLSEKVKKKYYPDLVHFRDQLERGKSS